MKNINIKSLFDKQNIDKITSSRKFKYGSSAAVFTAVFVVFVILINVVISVIDSKSGGLYVDLTSKNLYGISESSKEVLADVTSPIEIIFCLPSDKADDNAYLSYIKRLAESYKASYPNISLIFKDKISNPTYFDKFISTSGDVINTSSIIVNCPSTGKSIIYDATKLFKYSSQGTVFAFDGENKLTSAILEVSNPETLKAGFTTGHGEDGSNPLMFFLEQQGYEIHTVDLKTTSKEELSTFNLIVICNPVTDFSGLSQNAVTSTSEISALTSYLTGSFGNLLVFLNNETADLPELKQFLSDEWGISYTSGAIIKESAANDVSGDGYGFLGTYSTDSSSSGYAVHSQISKNSTSARAIFDYCVPLHTTFTQKGYKTVSPVVTTSQNASVIFASKSTAVANTPVMLLSDYSRTYDSGDKHAYVLVCGSTSFLNCLDYSDYYTNALQYANNDLMKSILKTFGKTNVAINIDFKVLDETNISVTQSDINSMTRRLSLIVPAIITVAGIVMFIKRKYL